MLKTKKLAKAAGEKHYDTKVVCVHGHMSPRYTSNGACIQCAHITMISTQRKVYDKKHYAGNAGKWREKQLIRDYGITIEQYNQMHEAQQGRCAICDTHQDDLQKALHVDHCHDTGVVRKLLCKLCNTALGNAKHDTELLGKMIEYLKGHI